MGFAVIRDATAKASATFNLQLQQGFQWDLRSLAVVILALLCLTAPMDVSQLVFALVGALAYAFVQALPAPPKGKAGSYTKRPPPTAAKSPHSWVRSPKVGGPMPPTVRNHPMRRNLVPPVGSAQVGAKPFAAPRTSHDAAVLNAPSTDEVANNADAHRQSLQPVLPPTFVAKGWNAEVEELVGLISPTTEVDKTVQTLARYVKKTLQHVIPEAEVMAFASGDLSRGNAFGVAVPEVNIVACASPHVLASRVQGPHNRLQQLDARRLQKSAIRCCTHRLVNSGNFKFRRSAFRGEEPKVTLLAPASFGIHSEAIPFDFSINSTTPLYNAALLTECGQIDPRARQLALLVKRWAKDRGVIHTAKGHLSPYAWTLLSVYFLQVGVEGAPLLPPLEEFAFTSGLTSASQASSVAAVIKAQVARGAREQSRNKWANALASEANCSIGELFRQFLKFYHEVFDFRNEAISVRKGRRAPPDLSLQLHIIVHDDGTTTDVGPTIEDPFDPKKNLGDCMGVESLARMKEEFRRAVGICGAGPESSLAELLEPWAPPVQTGENQSVEEDAEEPE